MRTNIIRIGNSKGIIIPSDILHKLRLSIKSAVNISIENEKIVIRPEPRKGWAEAAKQMHATGEDTLLIPDILKNEDFSDIPWE